MITVLAKLTALPGKEAEMQAALEAMVAEVDAKEPGVLAYTMHTNESSPDTSGCPRNTSTTRPSPPTTRRTT